MLQKKVGFVILFLTGVGIGVAWRHYNIAPFPQLHRWAHPKTIPLTPHGPIPKHNATAIVLYKKNVPLFIDRHYFDSSGTEIFDGSYLIQIQRHRTTSIKLLAQKGLIAYRILSESNDNTPFADWERSNVKAMVQGYGCAHEIIVHKKLAPGEHLLPAGGPIASSPLLIKVIEQDISDLGFEVQ